MSRKLALIIGNSEYDDANLARLVTPVADVGALAGLMRDTEIGGFDEVTTLINEPGTTIRRAISRFFKARRREDLLLLYFSGHGVLDDRGHLYLAVKDTERDLLRATAVPAAFITGEMDRSRSRRQVLILDCCHSGAFARGAKGAPGASVGTATAFEGTGYGRVVLTATDSTQYAWEGDQVIGESEHSVFTHYLIQGLRTGEADIDADGWIGLDEWYDYVYGRVVNETPKQTPGKWSYRQQGEIAIARNPRPVVRPVELPPELRQAIESPLAGVREGAVHELDRLLHSSDRGLALAARRALERLAGDDSRRVSTAASGSLATCPQVQRAREVEEELTRLYREALESSRRGDWQEAADELQQIVDVDQNYRDAAVQLAAARERLAKAEAKRDRHATVGALYERAVAAVKPLPSSVTAFGGAAVIVVLLGVILIVRPWRWLPTPGVAPVATATRTAQTPMVPTQTPTRISTSTPTPEPVESVATSPGPIAVWTKLGSLSGPWIAWPSPAYAVDQTIWATEVTGDSTVSVDGGATWTKMSLGAIRMFAPSPDYAEDQTVFASLLGGVYRSTDGGVSWQALGRTDVDAMAVALSPNYSADRTIFAGYNYDDGVYRSTDDGASWERMYWLGNNNIDALAISPGYPADPTIFAGTWTGTTESAGVFKSDDDGDSWESKGLTDFTLTALAISPNYPSDQTLFAVSSFNQTAWKSVNGGEDWSVVGISGATAIAFSPDYATDHTIFAGTAENGVYLSTDGGATWTEMNRGLQSMEEMRIGNLTVAPIDSLTMIVLAGTDDGVWRYVHQTTPDMVLIPPGTFLMGSSQEDRLAHDEERPQQQVELNAFRIGRYPVTNAQYARFIGDGGYENRAFWTEAGWAWREREGITQPEYWDHPGWNQADYPVVGVSWYEALAYCRWLSEVTGQAFGLPSEAEWEKAARGEHGPKWPWGDKFDPRKANTSESGLEHTTAVGHYSPDGDSPYGLGDMAGNVWEWCSTFYRGYPYWAGDGREDLEAEARRMLRGGSWKADQGGARCASRTWNHPDFRFDDVGFRVAASAGSP